MAETLSMLSTISYVISGISFAVAVFLWFKFKIPAVYGDLSGRTARKSIAQMRANNEKSGAKGFRPSAVNAERGKVTSAMTEPGKPQPKQKKQAKRQAAEDGRPETGLLNENLGYASQADETAMLIDDATAPLDDETVPLVPFAAPRVQRRGGKKLVMIEEVILVHANEVIPIDLLED